MHAKVIGIATLVAGTLDIAAAIINTALHGKSVPNMLRLVASGPLGEWPKTGGWIGAFAGLAVHFAIMAVMVTAFVAAAGLLPRLREWRLLYGAAYGALLYCVMYWLVIPLRWPPRAEAIVTPMTVLVPLTIHILLVGIPIALIASARRHRREATAI